MDPAGAQSTILIIRLVIANLELLNLSSRDDPAKGLLKIVSALGSQPPQERGPLATGAAGAAEVVTDVDAVDATEVAAALEAVTVNVYAVEGVKPVTEIGELLPVAVTPPGEEVTV